MYDFRIRCYKLVYVIAGVLTCEKKVGIGTSSLLLAVNL